MLSELPSLCFLPIERLIVHESHDDSRTRPLMRRIHDSGVLRNPPVVSPLQDGSQRFMVLDGANRVTAIRKLGYPHVLVQVVHPNDPGLHLETWNHVVWELNAYHFIAGIRSINDIHLAPCHPEDEPVLEGSCGLAMVRLCTGKAYSLCTEIEDLEARVRLLNQVVDSYKDRCRLDRTNSRDVHLLAEIYPQLSGVMIFPNFRIEQVLRLAGEGYLLPTGITRFTISPRALHLNYPLQELESSDPVEEKNERLQKWIQERIAKKAVRYYAEPTYLFDE